MNIYKHELKAGSKFALIWLIVMIGLMAIELSFYPSFTHDMDNFITIMKNIPDSMKAAFGVNIEVIGTIIGYYAFILTIILICAAIEAMIMGLSILSKEIRERTADFLLSKPVSRVKVVTAKLLASLTLIITTNIIIFVANIIILQVISNSVIDFKTYVLLTLVILFIQLLFFALGALISVIINKMKTVLPTAMGIVFGFYIFSSFGAENLRALMPFKYFDFTEILLNAKYELKYLVLNFAVVLVSILLTYLIYKKQDIDAV